jgi:hypothetical protein
MKTTTMCLLSGLFGALFAVACGAVSGVGDKEANAAPNSTLTKEIYEFTLEQFDLGTELIAEELDLSSNPVYSYYWLCTDGSRVLPPDDCGNESNTDKLIYVVIR